MKIQKRENQIWIFVVFAIVSLLVSAFLLVHNGINGVDAFYYWVNSAYFARGYNLEWVKETGFILDEIGDMQGIGVLPYGRVLNNFIFPGFLSYKMAYFYNSILIVFITGLLILNTYRWISEKAFFPDNKQSIIASLCFAVIPWLWPGYLRAGNIGGVIALMAILAAFYVDRNENISALLISFALIKPQIGGIFLIVVFLKKKYKLVLKILGIIAISEIIHILYTNIMNKVRGIYIPISLNSFISIFEGYAGKNAEEERGLTWYLYYGIFNMLRELSVPVIVVLFMSMIAGIVFVIFLLHLIKSNEELYNDNVVVFAIAALASLFWFYKSECDNIVLILCNLPLLYYLKGTIITVKKVAFSCVYLIGLNWLIGRYILRFPKQIVSYPVGILIDQLLQIVLFTILFVAIVRKEKEEK